MKRLRSSIRNARNANSSTSNVTTTGPGLGGGTNQPVTHVAAGAATAVAVGGVEGGRAALQATAPNGDPAADQQIPVPVPTAFNASNVVPENRSTTSLFGTQYSGSGTGTAMVTAAVARVQRGGAMRARLDPNANAATEVGESGSAQMIWSGAQQVPVKQRGSIHGLNFQTLYTDWSGAGSDGEERTHGGGISVTTNKTHIHPDIWTEFRANTTLCDVILQTTDGAKFHAHRPILAASSPFFKVLFTELDQDRSQGQNAEPMVQDGDFKEELQIVPLTNIGSKSLSTILDFMYSGQFQFAGEDSDLLTLIPITQRLKLFGLLQQCRAWLLNHLTPANAIEMYKLSVQHFCPSFQAEIKRYILRDFFQITQTAAFGSLEFELLEEFLRDDHLNAKSEECVFVAIRKWIQADPCPARLSRLVELFQCIRFGLMSFQYFMKHVYAWKYVQEDEDVQKSLFDASFFLSQIDSTPESEVDLNDPLARPRIPHQLIFAVGGWSAGSPTNFMETYDTRADRWFLTPYSDANPRAYHGLVTVDNLIYMLGGFDGQDHFNTMRCYNPVTKEWSEKSCMHFPRCYVSCCVLDRHIYALGGFNGRSRMNTVERYSVDRNQWEMMPSMSRQRSDAAAAALGGKIYIAGGFNGQEVLPSVEVFDPIENQWTFLRPMHTPRSGVTLTIHKSMLYAVGGFNGFTRLATGERYDPAAEVGEWTAIANMNTARSNFAAAAVDDWLFAIGGFNGTTTIPFCECYDDQADEWYDICSMNLNRSALSACVLNGLRNAQEYSYLSRVHELLGLPAPATGLTSTASGRPRTRPRHNSTIQPNEA